MEQILWGIQSSLEECGPEPKASGAADPSKAWGLRGAESVEEGGRISGQKPGHGSLEASRAVLSTLISLMCNGHRGAWRVAVGFGG